MKITAEMLRDQYTRCSLDWLEREGIGYNKIVYRHHDRKTLIIALQRPELRRQGDSQDFILRTDAMEAYYRYEQKGKVARRNGNGDLTRQIWLMGVTEGYRWNHYNYPKPSEILCDGVMETLENVRSRVLSLRDQLFTHQSRDGEICFIDADWQPIAKVGADPDEPQPRRRREAEPAPRRMGSVSVDVLITDGVDDDITLRFPGVTAARIVEALEDKFGRAESDDKLPF